MPSRRPNMPLSLVGEQDRREVSDVELARGLVAGSGWAIVETWRRFAPMVLTTAARALGSEVDAEDVAQEVFQRVFRKARTLRDPDKLRSFIFSFAVRVLRSALRRKARGWLVFRRPESFVDLGGESINMEARDLLRRFYALLDRLPAKDRLVFALRHLESMTVEEVAASTELSESTVKRTLAHATDKLSRLVESDLGLVGFLEGRGWNQG
jgi:RNA polymerase sigma-70 factor, ECF subfamily